MVFNVVMVYKSEQQSKPDRQIDFFDVVMVCDSGQRSKPDGYIYIDRQMVFNVVAGNYKYKLAIYVIVTCVLNWCKEI